MWYDDITKLFLAQTPLPHSSLTNLTTIWLLLGVILCGLEFILPSAFIELVMGVSALILAGLTLLLPIPLPLGWQVILWMAFSGGGIFLSRRFAPKHKAHILEDAQEAETLTEIPIGVAGRVRYQGNSWKARCEDQTIAIAPGQKVLVIRREGTTLIVMPEYILHS